ncbi:hypothetical protein C8A00DRAFT_33239 [Chaetomidium leptoderma]|uniref:Heterokaryon incompatibility domain-containing protein n=1 Tax=Chaetomidium leptoderma TaxID=669021 RepID=A0AAN6VNG0_9PEZI|nr:hypothetical protein C8A00DRAFT_33239 [Chaetomidium leptoderma]
MFRWYGDAELCYAFLSDVNPEESPHSWSSTFRQSRWFTRGWTLQELIAPGVVYFYGAGWKQIGSRDKLLDLIVEITQISANYFTTGDLSQFSAAQKMSWAANRNTTRPEDEAYCLLGLFDINMPLLYGEGKRAFLRLQEEILRQSDDDSLFCHNQNDIIATSPWWFRYCHAISRREAWPYKNNPSLVLDRHLSFNRNRITMIFPVVRVSAAEKLDDFCSVAWPRTGAPPQTCYLALLNCGTSESTSTLILKPQSEEGGSPGVYVKLAFRTRGVVRAAWKPRLAHRLETMTLSISRATTSPRGAWEWRAGNELVFFGNALLSQVRTDADSAHLRPVMKPIVRPPPPALAEGGGLLSASQDGLRDKVVVKGPCRTTTSGFQLQYVYVAGFRLTWLERGDEVHLIPSDTGNQGQPCVVFSNPARESFMVTLEPTRAAVNANLYTNIPWWEGKETLAYMEKLEGERKASKGEALCDRAAQRVDGGREVVVQIETRRRRNGWWVGVTVSEPPEDNNEL